MAFRGDPFPARRFGISEEWQQFYLAMLLLMVVPAGGPLIMDLVFAKGHALKEQTVTLTAALYLVTIACSTRRVTLAVIYLIFAAVFGVMFGAATAVDPSRSGWTTSTFATLIGILAFSLAQAGERYNRHVGEGTPFFEFKGKGP